MREFREKTDGSEHDHSDLAKLAASLYDSDGFEADLRAAVRDVLQDHVAQSDIVDVDELDLDAEHTFEDQLFKNGRGGLYLLRGELVTNEVADIAPRDVIRMQAANDPDKTIHFVVHEADPDSDRIRAIKVDPEKDEQSYYTPGLQAGHVLHGERFEIARPFRDDEREPWRVASGLLDELTPVAEGDA